MESCGSAIERRGHFDVLKEQQGQEELELRLGLGLGLGLGSGDDDDMKMVVRNNHLGSLSSSSSSSSLVVCTNTSIPHYSPPGIWFSLRSSVNRKGEFLPQLPKTFIRVKDEKVTVFMLKTYLVTKLGLSNQAEVEISCMGQNLMHTITLKHVRDAIWLPGLVEFLKSNTEFIKSSQGASLNYLMSLDYGKTCL
ncbi:E3 ubiquitin protein ligase DRIP2 [Solanum lycopersicum]|uniref:E3 ubiquitin protein ligase DRIP2 n=1 Tax=Solanum lycopersicum TaxID=4081 RepID=UPI000532AECB|nr:E3 ubiquitin protein ligase DRIP2-like [Solanum lycopersicum]